MNRFTDRHTNNWVEAPYGGLTMVSYRGPGKKGGVSSALAVVAKAHADNLSRWLFVEEGAVSAWNPASPACLPVTALNEELVQRHYSFCNNTLWPMFHGLNSRVAFSWDDWTGYKELSAVMAGCVRGNSIGLFVHDYQLALLPGLLKNQAENRQVLVFWHIPWPGSVPPWCQEFIVELVQSLAQSDVIGFHTEEYRDNFKELVRRLCPATLMPKLVVAPLGLDSSIWQKAAWSSVNPLWKEIQETRYVLSVDRADYTKGVVERLEAIREFFATYSQWKKQVVFVQLCPRTREGLSDFDRYWTHCGELAEEIDQQYCTSDWHPIHWLSESLGTDAVAALYRDADVMLVSPIRDGLNLTAKEFVVSQVKDPGVLVLSKMAGVFQEIGEFALSIDPQKTDVVAAQIDRALSMLHCERVKRIEPARQAIDENSLAGWWTRMTKQDDKGGDIYAEVFQVEVSTCRQCDGRQDNAN